MADCADSNMRLVNLSTPANYFHALRRQVLSPLAKPLVVLAPKALLRHPRCVSRLDDFAGGFQPVIGDVAPVSEPSTGPHSGRDTGPRRPVRRVVLSTGKLAVLLRAARDEAGIDDVALVRLEQLYPLDGAALARALAPFPDAELVWAQEEPENMGYFALLDRRLEAVSGRPWRLVTRPASPSAAAGPKKWDDAHLKAVIAMALEGE